MGGKPGEKVLPVVFILMQKRTYKAYEEAFGALKNSAQSLGFNLNPKLGLIDFERAARKALKFHFPSIKLRGCYFHYKQAVGRWVYHL